MWCGRAMVGADAGPIPVELSALKSGRGWGRRRLQLSQPRFVCRLCSLLLNTISAVKRHLRKAHGRDGDYRASVRREAVDDHEVRQQIDECFGANSKPTRSNLRPRHPCVSCKTGVQKPLDHVGLVHLKKTLFRCSVAGCAYKSFSLRGGRETLKHVGKAHGDVAEARVVDETAQHFGDIVRLAAQLVPSFRPRLATLERLAQIN